MSGEYQDLERAKDEAEKARKRLIETLGTIKHRLSPGVLAAEAWGGVRGKTAEAWGDVRDKTSEVLVEARDKGAELADDAFQTVKERPKTAALVLAAVTIFLARDPLKAVASRIFSKDPEDEDLVTTRLDDIDENYDLTAPVVARSVHEGAST